MEQNVEEAYLSGNVMMMGVARLRLLRNSTPRHPSLSRRSLFASKKIYERQDWLAIRRV